MGTHFLFEKYGHYRTLHEYTIWTNKQYGPYEKKYDQQNRFIFDLIIASANFIQNGSLVTGIRIFGKYVRLISYNINLLLKV